jgi:hypothetical protein
MATKIQLRRDTATSWASANSVLSQGEPGLDITNNALKIGDGITAWSDLQIIAGKYPAPNVAYTGVFNGYPANIPITKGQGVFYTSNNHILETDKYWWDDEFDTYNYDLSGVETLNFYNLGGIKVDFRLGGKSETLITDVNLHDIAVVGDDFYLESLPALETFSANNLTYVGYNFDIYSMDKIDTQFNFPNLKTIQNAFDYTYNNVLENTPQFPALETVGTLNIYENSATQNTMTFDSLRFFEYAGIYNNVGMLAGPEFPALTSFYYFGMYNNDSMIDPPTFPDLETAGGFDFYGNLLVSTAPATPSLVTTSNISWYDNPAMANGVNFTALKEVNGTVDFSGNALDETSVNYILTTLAGLDGTNGTTSYNSKIVNVSGGTNAIPGTSGAAAIVTLEARGCTVTRNT